VHHRTTLSGYVSATKARIDNWKKLVKQQYLPTCSYNMVNFGPLAAEIVSLVWGTPGNFNGFRVLSALLHSQTVATNRGRHLYSAGRPSSGALATFLVIFCYTISAMTLLVGQQEEGRPTHEDLLQSFLFGRPGPTWSNSRKNASLSETRSSILFKNFGANKVHVNWR